MIKRRYPVIIFLVVSIVAALMLSLGLVVEIPSAAAQKSNGSGPQEESPPNLRNKVRKLSGPTRQIGNTRAPVKDDPLARIQAMLESRGQETSATVEREVREAKRQREEHPDRFSEDREDPKTPKWKSLGPTSDDFIQNSVTINEVDSGRLRTILPDPHDADTVYVLSSGGGLWKTTNFRSSRPRWVPMTDSVGTTSGGSVAFGRDSDTLYLGAGDPFDAPGGFMVRSKDGGKSWTQPFVLPGATNVRDVKVDTSRANDIVLVATDFGLFRSTNGGATFTAVAAGSGQAFHNMNVWSLVKTSAGWLANALPNGGFIGEGIGSLFYSTDQGATWNPIPNAGNVYNNAGRTTLAVAGTGESTVYGFAGDISGFSQRDLFKSTDGGLNWTALNITGKTPTNPNFFQPDMQIISYQAWYNQLLLVDPTDSSRNTVYIGGELSTAKTTDGGNTWTLLTDWLPSPDFGIFLPYVHADCHAAAFSGLGGRNTLFFGTDGGLFVSTDSGSTWDSSKNTGLVDELLYSLTVSGAHSDETLIGLQDLGTRFRVGHSKVYNQVFGGDGIGTAWSQANDNVSLCTVEGDFYFRSINNPPDDQSKFLDADNNDILDYFFYFFTPLTSPTAVGDPTGNIFVTYTPTFIYATTDGAAHWNVLANIDEGNNVALSNIHAGPPFSMFFRNVVHGLGVSGDLSHVGVASSGGQVALSADGGTNWIVPALNSEVPDSGTRLGFHSFTSNVTWATNTEVYVTSINPSPGVTRVVKSTQGGAPGSWRAAQNGLPDVPVNRLLVDAGDPSGRTLFAATDLGVYRTTNGGRNWELFGGRLPQVRVTDLYTPPDGRFLRIATYGRGVWEIKLRGEGED